MVFWPAFGDKENKTAHSNTPAVTQEVSTPVTEPAVAEAGSLRNRVKNGKKVIGRLHLVKHLHILN